MKNVCFYQLLWETNWQLKIAFILICCSASLHQMNFAGSYITHLIFSLSLRTKYYLIIILSHWLDIRFNITQIRSWSIILIRRIKEWKKKLGSVRTVYYVCFNFCLLNLDVYTFYRLWSNSIIIRRRTKNLL